MIAPHSMHAGASDWFWKPSPATASTPPVAAGAAGDTVQALKIPAGALVDEVFCIVRTAQGATCTATVGDGAAAAAWDASINLNAAAGTLTSALEGTDAYAAGKFYSAADTIDLVLGHTTNAAKITVCARYAMIEV